MAIERRVQSFADWIAEGERLFGKVREDWRFRCVKCGGVQTIRDFMAAGMKFEDAARRVHFSCIGRWVPDRGCDWTLGGLFQIHTLEVEMEDKTRISMFEFAGPDADPAPGGGVPG